MKMYGIPVDAKPFLMAILDGFGTPEVQAVKIWQSTSHLYVQKLKDYVIVPSTATLKEVEETYGLVCSSQSGSSPNS